MEAKEPEMNQSISRAVSGLYADPSRRTNNVKFYFRPGTTAEQLSDYRNRANSQITSGVSLENVDLDEDLLD